MNINSIKEYFLSFLTHDNGWICFQIGLFFLPSSALISTILLLIAGAIGSLHRQDSYFSDPWNYPLFIAGLLMIIGSIQAYSGWLAWIGLGNWLPFFWCFWAFQSYLMTPAARKRSAFLLVLGTLPVLVTGFGQFWFGWQGPWTLFDGLIIWFISPGGNPLGRLSGLFDYANIAGAWLAIIWPLCLGFLLTPSLSWQKRFLALLFSVFLVTALVLTDSRNAWGALILAVPFVVGTSNWFWLLPGLMLCFLPVAFAVFPGVNLGLQEWSRNIVPESIWTRLNDMQFQARRPLEITRIHQWKTGLEFIFQKPLFGWGAASFSILYSVILGVKQWGHIHNLPLELAMSHGIPVSILLVGMVFTLLFCSLRKGILVDAKESIHHRRNGLYDRAWWTATFILVSLHGADLPLFDSRINIAGWILLAGLRCHLISSNYSIQSLPSSTFR